jgi:hypothetical protein
MLVGSWAVVCCLQQATAVTSSSLKFGLTLAALDSEPTRISPPVVCDSPLVEGNLKLTEAHMRPYGDQSRGSACSNFFHHLCRDLVRGQSTQNVRSEVEDRSRSRKLFK